MPAVTVENILTLPRIPDPDRAVDHSARVPLADGADACSTVSARRDPYGVSGLAQPIGCARNRA